MAAALAPGGELDMSTRIWIVATCVLALGFTACQGGGLTGGGAKATGVSIR